MLCCGLSPCAFYSNFPLFLFSSLLPVHFPLPIRVRLLLVFLLLLSFRLSFFISVLLYFLRSLFPSFLPSFLPSSALLLPPSLLPSFAPSVLPPFLPFSLSPFSSSSFSFSFSVSVSISVSFFLPVFFLLCLLFSPLPLCSSHSTFLPSLLCLTIRTIAICTRHARALGTQHFSEQRRMLKCGPHMRPSIVFFFLLLLEDLCQEALWETTQRNVNCMVSCTASITTNSPCW